MSLTKAESAVTHSTFVLERSFPVTPERVFAALADPERKRRWMAGDRGMAVEEFASDFRVGGSARAQYRFPEGSPFPGAALANDGVYIDIVPERRVVVAYTMAIDGRRISASLATFELLPGDGGTALIFTHQGAYFEGADGPQMRQEGWSKLLDRLSAVVAG